MRHQPNIMQNGTGEKGLKRTWWMPSALAVIGNTNRWATYSALCSILRQTGLHIRSNQLPQDRNLHISFNYYISLVQIRTLLASVIKFIFSI
jgi:hypothetical protein